MAAWLQHRALNACDIRFSPPPTTPALCTRKAGVAHYHTYPPTLHRASPALLRADVQARRAQHRACVPASGPQPHTTHRHLEVLGRSSKCRLHGLGVGQLRGRGGALVRTQQVGQLPPVGLRSNTPPPPAGGRRRRRVTHRLWASGNTRMDRRPLRGRCRGAHSCSELMDTWWLMSCEEHGPSADVLHGFAPNHGASSDLQAPCQHAVAV